MDEGFSLMPQFPARIIVGCGTFETWLKRYKEEAGVIQALVLDGSPETSAGAYHSSMQLSVSSAFDAQGLSRLHVVDHPEGIRDIDTDGDMKLVDKAARRKSDFAELTDASIAMVTQFAFYAAPVLAWACGMEEAGIDLTVHVRVAGRDNHAEYANQVRFSPRRMH